MSDSPRFGTATLPAPEPIRTFVPGQARLQYAAVSPSLYRVFLTVVDGDGQLTEVEMTGSPCFDEVWDILDDDRHTASTAVVVMYGPGDTIAGIRHCRESDIVFFFPQRRLGAS